MSDNVNKVVVAYSGGLDTSVIVPWLRENYGCEVICFTADIGQGDELQGLEDKAMASGASKLVQLDLRQEFARDYLFPMLQSGAVYEHKYLLGTAIARPLIAMHQAAIALAEGADALAHGCTGKGNDQVRFELTYKATSPQLKVIAPWREWELRSREDALDYAAQHGVPVAASAGSIYSRDRNLWHISHEGGPLEDPAHEADPSLFQLTAAPKQAPDQPQTIEIGFEAGIPISVDGEPLDPAELVEKLNQIGGRHGVGRADMVENRLVGVKSRGVYETPGGTLLSIAHRDLESICLDRDTLHYKQLVALRYAELIYFGKWFTPLRQALAEFIAATQTNLTGWARVRLYKGSATAVARYSPHSLYREDLATFGADQVYDQRDAKGFIDLFGLQMKVRALMQQVPEAPAEVAVQRD